MEEEENTVITLPRPTDFSEGRDEMNLAEIAFTLLARRPGVCRHETAHRFYCGKKKKWVDQKLLMVSPEGVGVPIAVDEWVIIGLMKLCMTNDFQARRVKFFPSALFDVLRWDGKGRNYRRLSESLTRLKRTTYSAQNTWFDNENKVLKSQEEFSILSYFHLVKREDSRVGGEYLASEFEWGPTIFKSFQDSYLKKLDLTLLASFRNESSRKFYRIVDKAFGRQSTPARVVYGLEDFAFRRLGMRGVSYERDINNVKKQINKCYDEVANAGVIAALPKEERYVRRNGRWELLVEQASSRKETPVTGRVSLPRKGEESFESEAVKEKETLREDLMSRGFRQCFATEIIADAETSYEGIDAAIVEHDTKLSAGYFNHEEAKPNRWLYRRIKRTKKAPLGYVTRREMASRAGEAMSRTSTVERLASFEHQTFTAKEITFEITAGGLNRCGKEQFIPFATLPTQDLERVLKHMEGKQHEARGKATAA